MDAQGKIADGSELPKVIAGIERMGGCAVVRLRGELSAAQCDEVGRELRGLFDTSGTRVVLDCSALGFVASAGLGTLVGLQKRALQSGGSLCMASAKAPIASLMKMTRLEAIIPLFENVEKAVAGGAS